MPSRCRGAIDDGTTPPQYQGMATVQGHCGGAVDSTRWKSVVDRRRIAVAFAQMLAVMDGGVGPRDHTCSNASSSTVPTPLTTHQCGIPDVKERHEQVTLLRDRVHRALEPCPRARSRSASTAAVSIPGQVGIHGQASVPSRRQLRSNYLF